MPRITQRARLRLTRALVVMQVFLLIAALFAPIPVAAADPVVDPSPTPSATPIDTPTPAPSDAPAPVDSAAPSDSAAPVQDPAAPAASDPATTDAPTAAPSAAPTVDPSPTQAPAGPATSYIVTFAAGSSGAARDAALAATDATVESTVPVLGLAVISVPAGSSAVATLRADPAVAAVELDKVRAAEALPDDPAIDSQWALGAIGWTDVVGTTPSGAAVVAVLDTGVDGSHADLAGQLVSGTSILDGSAGTADPNGHGTAMAGLIAAATGNGINIAGVGFAGVKVMPVTVLGADGLGADSDIIAGVVWAVQHHADVISMSFSNPGFSPALQAAIDYAWAHDVVIVAATGNDGTTAVTYPAGDRGVIGVSNTDSADVLNVSSNRGADTFIAAPGTAIVSLAAGGGTTSVTGTSASAAIVAAAAAQLRAFDPAASNGTIVGRLARTADAVGTVSETGNGRLNLARAIADTDTAAIEPAGAAPLGSGGPFVGPYQATAANVSSFTIGAQSGTPVYSVSSPATYAISLSGSGNGALAIGVTGLPFGATFAPSSSSSCNLSQNGCNFTLTITSGSATPAGTSTFTLTVNGVSNTKTFVVAKASSVTVVTCPTSVTFTGVALTPCSASVSGAGGLAATLAVSYLANTSAGTATANATYAGDANHLGSSNTKTFTIDKAPSTTAVTCPASVTYSGVAQTPCTASVSGAGGLSASLSVGYANNTNAGTATASASYAGDANHNVSSDAKLFTISKATPNCTVTAYSATYDADPHTATGTCTGVLSETLDGLNLAGTTHTSAGDWLADPWTFTDATGNYNPASGTVHDHLDQKGLTITADDRTKTYGETLVLGTAAFSKSGLVGSDSVTAVTLSSAGAAAGAGAATYPVTPSSAVGSGLANYAITYVDGSLVVAKAIPTCTILGYSVTYDADPHTATGACTGVGGVSLSGLDLSATTHTHAGDNPADPWTFTDVTGNYHDADGSVQDTIGQRPVTITADPGSKTYGDADPVLTWQITSGNLVGDDAIGGLLSREAGERAGTYAIGQGSLALSSDYALTFAGATFTVNQRALTVTASGGDKTYDASADTSVLLGDDRVPGDQLTLSYGSASFDDANAGDGKTVTVGGITVTGPDADNYTWNTTATTTASIARRPIAVSADPQTKVYGAADPALTSQITSGSLAGDDVLTGALVRVVGEHVGSYAITQGTLTAGSNYDLTFTGSALDITPASLTVTPQPQTRTYGDAAGAYPFDTAGFAFDEDASSALDYTAPVCASLYGPTTPVSASGLAITCTTGMAHDYTFDVTATASLAILRKALTVTADSRGKTYGDTVTFAGTEFSTDGLVNDDEVTSVALVSDGAAPTAGVSGSPYAISASAASGSGLDNYLISYVDGALTVDPLTVTLNADNRSKTYGDDLDLGSTAFQLSVTLPNGDAFAGVTLASAGAPAGAGAGSYPVTASDAVAAPATSLDNYAISYAAGTLTVDPAVLTVTADDLARTYGDPNPPLTAAISGFVNDETLATSGVTGEPALTTAATASSPVGSYAITVGIGSLAADNYSFDPVAGTLAVGYRPITVTADPQTKVYGDADPALTYQMTLGSLAPGDAFTGALDRDPGDGAGDYAITQGTLALSTDYALTFVGSTLSITKAPSLVTVTCTPSSIVYTGSALEPCTAVATGAGSLSVALAVGYTGNRDAGTASASATFDGDDNHDGSSGSATFEITPAGSSVAVSCPVAVTYSGVAQTPCAAVVTGAGGLSTPLSVTYANNSSVGTASASASFAGDANHSSSDGGATFGIERAAPVCTVTPYHVTFDGAPHQASGGCVGVLGESLDGLVLSATVNTHAGDYAADAWTFTDITGNYENAVGTVHDVIDAASSNVTVAFEAGPYGYRGTAFAATASVAGAGGLASPLSVAYTGDCLNVTSANGCTATASFPGDADHQPATGSASITITPVDATCVVHGYSVTVDGQPHTALGACTGVGGGILPGLDLTGTTHSAVGSWPSDPWSFTDPAGNYLPASGSVADEILVAVPDHLVIGSQPTTAIANRVLPSALVVQVVDASGNAIAAPGISVTVSLYDPFPETAWLTGFHTRTTDATGAATFADFSIDTPGTYVVEADAAGLGSAFTSDIVVSAAPISIGGLAGDASWANHISGVDVLFTKSGSASTTSYTLRATNPGTFQYQLSLGNETGAEIHDRLSPLAPLMLNGVPVTNRNGATMTVVLTVPSMPSSVGTTSPLSAAEQASPAFVLVGNRPVRVYPHQDSGDGDELSTQLRVSWVAELPAGVTDCASVTTWNTTPLGDGAVVRCIKIDGLSIRKHDEANIRVSYEFRWKNRAGWGSATSDASLAFRAGFNFVSTSQLTLDAFDADLATFRLSHWRRLPAALREKLVNDYAALWGTTYRGAHALGLVLAGEKLTALGGFAFDTAANGIRDVTVRVFSSAPGANACNASLAYGTGGYVASAVTAPDGFWFIWQSGLDNTGLIGGTNTLPAGSRYVIALCDLTADHHAMPFDQLYWPIRSMSHTLGVKEFDEEDFFVSGPTQLVFQAQPLTGQANRTLGTVKVALLDGFGNVMTMDSSSTVTLTEVTANGPSSVLLSTLATQPLAGRTLTNGTATWTGLKLTASGLYKLSVDSSVAAVPDGRSLAISIAN